MCISEKLKNFERFHNQTENWLSAISYKIADIPEYVCTTKTLQDALDKAKEKYIHELLTIHRVISTLYFKTTNPLDERSISCNRDVMQNYYGDVSLAENEFLTTTKFNKNLTIKDYNLYHITKAEIDRVWLAQRAMKGYPVTALTLLFRAYAFDTEVYKEYIDRVKEKMNEQFELLSHLKKTLRYVDSSQALHNLSGVMVMATSNAGVLRLSNEYYPKLRPFLYTEDKSVFPYTKKEIKVMCNCLDHVKRLNEALYRILNNLDPQCFDTEPTEEIKFYKADYDDLVEANLKPLIITEENIERVDNIFDYKGD